MGYLLTNTWLDASVQKPWTFRMVLVRFDDGSEDRAMWNGSYWAAENGIRQVDIHKKVISFYIYERYNGQYNTNSMPVVE